MISLKFFNKISSVNILLIFITNSFILGLNNLTNEVNKCIEIKNKFYAIILKEKSILNEFLTILNDLKALFISTSEIHEAVFSGKK